MSRLVLKFGGTSVRDADHINRVAEKVIREIDLGNEVAVVVSARSGITDELENLCFNLAGTMTPDPVEYDAIVSSGENQTAGLLALALQAKGYEARSWQGPEVPIICEGHHRKARIKEIRADKVRNELEQGKVAVLAGFQGIMEDTMRVATLGRGGSDTTAVAFAIALGADRCDIYTDVDGIYTADPRIVDVAQMIKYISCEEALELASLGSKVLQTRSVELALKYGMQVQVLSSLKKTIGSDFPGSILVRENQIKEKNVVTGITSSKNEGLITVSEIPNIPGAAYLVTQPLSKNAINIDMIVQNAPNGEKAKMTFTVPRGELDEAKKAIKAQRQLEDINLETDDTLVKVSIVGAGMRERTGVAHTMFKTLADNKINITSITTSEIGISVLIDQDYHELAIRKLHTAFDLDAIRDEFNPVADPENYRGRHLSESMLEKQTEMFADSVEITRENAENTETDKIKESMETPLVTGISCSIDVARLSVSGLPNEPGVAAEVTGALADANVNLDMIGQNAPNGNDATMTITVPRDQLERAIEAIKSRDTLKGVKLKTDDRVAKASIVGVGMKSHTNIAGTMFGALGNKEVNMDSIMTSEMGISVLIYEELIEPAIATLHSAFDLDKRTHLKAEPCQRMKI